MSPLIDSHADLVARRASGWVVLLPNQWSLRPAGRQVPLGDFPVNIAMHPGVDTRRSCIAGMANTR